MTNDLQRLVLSFPNKQSPERFVPFHHLLPGAPKRRFLEATGQST